MNGSVWRVLFVLAFSPVCRADQLGIFNFTGTSTGDNQLNFASNASAGLTFGNFLRSGVFWSAGANVFNSSGWALTSGGFGGAADSAKFTTFTISCNPGYSLSLTNLSFLHQRSATGATNLQVSLFVNGSLAPAETSITLQPGTSLSSFNFDFADVNSVNTAEFRFYGFATGGSSGTLRVDDVALHGVLVPVPEPTGLWLLGLLGAGGWKLFRKKS